MATQPARKMLDYSPDPNKFDLRTHIWDGQGQLVRKNLYTNHCVEGRNYFERPIHSGNLWYENNTPAGRVEYVNGVKSIHEGAPHKEFTPIPDGDDALIHALEAEKARSADLAAELAAIKAEREPKVETAGTAKPEGEALTLKAKGK